MYTDGLKTAPFGMIQQKKKLDDSINKNPEKKNKLQSKKKLFKLKILNLHL